jgi:hypothetical protein
LESFSRVVTADVSSSQTIQLNSSNNWKVGFEVFDSGENKVGTIQSVDSAVQVTLVESVNLLANRVLSARTAKPALSALDRLSAGPVSAAGVWRSDNSLASGTKIYGGSLRVQHNASTLMPEAVVTEGMTVYGPGLAANTVVRSVVGATQFTLNQPPLTGTSFPPLILTGTNISIPTGTLFTGSSFTSSRNGFGLGMTVTGPGIPAGAFISSFSDTGISISMPVTASAANNQEIRFSYSPFFPRMNNVSMEVGSKSISYVSRDSGVAVGMLVVGEGIPPGTTIVALPSTRSATLSEPAIITVNQTAQITLAAIPTFDRIGVGTTAAGTADITLQSTSRLQALNNGTMLATKMHLSGPNLPRVSPLQLGYLQNNTVRLGSWGGVPLNATADAQSPIIYAIYGSNSRTLTSSAANEFVRTGASDTTPLSPEILPGMTATGPGVPFNTRVSSRSNGNGGGFFLTNKVTNATTDLFYFGYGYLPVRDCQFTAGSDIIVTDSTEGLVEDMV